LGQKKFDRNFAGTRQKRLSKDWDGKKKRKNRGGEYPGKPSTPLWLEMGKQSGWSEFEKEVGVKMPS